MEITIDVNNLTRIELSDMFHVVGYSKGTQIYDNNEEYRVSVYKLENIINQIHTFCIEQELINSN